MTFITLGSRSHSADARIAAQRQSRRADQQLLRARQISRQPGNGIARDEDSQRHDSQDEDGPEVAVRGRAITHAGDGWRARSWEHLAAEPGQEEGDKEHAGGLPPVIRQQPSLVASGSLGLHGLGFQEFRIQHLGGEPLGLA